MYKEPLDQKYKIGDKVNLPNNTVAEVVEIRSQTSQWGMETGSYEVMGRIISSDSDAIIGEVHVVAHKVLKE